ncbi:MAG: isoleucine--tRNA ligase [bacterium]
MTNFRAVAPNQDFPEMEERVLADWRERKVFERSLTQREDAPLWSFYEGPPTANGKPGSHHVLSRVFKDVYPRYKAMKGHYVPRKAGWDCHGLPVELEVEKELGISSKDEIEEYGIAEFNARCRDSVFRYVEDWNGLTERIGFWIDLDDPYVTMDDDYIESVWWAISQMWNADSLYEGHKVVPYCPRCGTALSSHEVALGYREVEDLSAYVKFEVSEPGASRAQVGDSLLVWTTTPWTLLSNAAVAIGKGIEYVRAVPADGDGVLILAAERVEQVLGEGAGVLDRFEGSDLAGTRYLPPFPYLDDFGPNSHKALEASFVTTDEGTGMVHTALAFGEDDFRFGQDHDLALINPVRLDGRFDSSVGEYEGRFVKEADRDIVTALDESGSLFRSEAYLHSYPHCWRCDTPLLYYAKSSWYVRTSDARDRMLEANKEIGWHPDHIRDGRFGRWLEGNVDWALSRDRYWGTPLPIWRCGSDGCDQTVCIGSREDLVKHGGEVPDDLHRPYIDEVELDCPADGCGGRMVRSPAVIDTWFDSGSMPWAQYHYPFENREVFEQRFPADFICEAIDQTRGWFYTLLAESVQLFDRTSYLNCVCLGLILDGDGQKMSKSKGNVVSPQEVIDSHGADALRWYYLTSQQPWSGYRFSSEAVGESMRQFLLTLWNTYSFWVLYANTEELDSASSPDAPDDPVDELDRWILSRLQGTVAAVSEQMDGFDCTSAGREISTFTDDLSNWYVRLCRSRFWEGDSEAFATLRHCLVQVAKLLAPFTPFVADEIYSNLVGGARGDFGEQPDSVHLCDFPEADQTRVDHDLETSMSAVHRTVELGRAARAQAKVKIRQPLRRAIVVANDEERAAVERLESLVASELNVKEIDFVSDATDLVSYRVKPNYRSLGPRFGKEMPLVAAAVEALDPAVVSRVTEGGGQVGISIEGKEHELLAEDLDLAMEPLDGYEVEASSGHAVALSVELDDELLSEGQAREIVRAVQNARKEAGFEVSDRIKLDLGGDEDLIAAAREHTDYITSETLSEEIGWSPGASSTTVKIEDRELVLEVQRITTD